VNEPTRFRQVVPVRVTFIDTVMTEPQPSLAIRVGFLEFDPEGAVVALNHGGVKLRSGGVVAEILEVIHLLSLISTLHCTREEEGERRRGGRGGEERGKGERLTQNLQYRPPMVSTMSPSQPSQRPGYSLCVPPQSSQ